MSVSAYPSKSEIFESVSNSTTTPLGSGATFTGTGEKTDYPQVSVVLKTDNSGTLYFDFSTDGTNWDFVYPVSGFSIVADEAVVHSAIKFGRYFRVRLVNDTGAQTYLRLNTYYGNGFAPITACLNQQLNLDHDSTVVRPTIGQDEICLNRRFGVTSWNIFGYRDDLQSGSGEQMIWATSGNFTPLTSAETFDIAYDGTSGGSTDGSGTTGATELTFYYIDANGLPAVSTHTLGTDGSDTTSFSGLGINKCIVSASGSSDYNVSSITITATTAGTTQAFLPATESISQQALFFTGSNHIGVFKFLSFNVNKLSASDPVATIKGYIYNRTTSTRREIYRHTIDSEVENTIVLKDPTGVTLSATDILYFVADTDTDDTIITMRFSLNEYQLS